MKLDAELQAIADEAMADLRAGRVGASETEGLWWERRRENELTPDYLSRVLAEAGLEDMADDASAGHYDDFACPADVADGLETLRLVRDLRRGAAAGDATRAERIEIIERAVRNGEFDATKAESDRWVASEDGQAALRKLTEEPVRTAARRDRVGRNDPCPCGSGRKYKRCHGG